MNGKSRPTGGSRTLARSKRNVHPTADEVLADARAKGRHEDVAILLWLLGRTR